MKKDIIKSIQELATELNRNPKRDEFVKLNKHSITKRELLKHFQTYTDALIAADLSPIVDRRNLGTTEISCSNCSTLVTKANSAINHNSHNFCSKSCAVTYNNKLKPKRADGKYIPVEKTCSNCNSTHIKDGTNITNTCSRICWIEIGMKQRLMKDIVKRTGANAYDNVRKNARLYSKYFYPLKCMLCGYDKHYEVCHVKDIKDFTGEETIYEVNNKTNLIHLCPNCHWEFDHNQIDLSLIREAQLNALTN